MIGKLNRNMYGFRDARSGWQQDWRDLLSSEGYSIGRANPALFYNVARKSLAGVHGDDFVVVVERSALNKLSETLASKYSVRESHRLGFGAHCCREATVLNRVISVGVGDDGWKFLWIEPDARHSELVLSLASLARRM